MQKRTLPMYLFLNCITLGVYGFIVGRQMGNEIDALCKGDKQSTKLGYTGAFFLRWFIPFYFDYWWYQQANRLKLNANRYGITVKESGTDNFLMRVVLNYVLVFATLAEWALAFTIPALVVWLSNSISEVLALIFLILFVLVFLLFSAELNVGANIANYYMMKNLNRFADVYRNGAAPFDPMAYEYYPSASNKYPNFIPGMINGNAVVGATPAINDDHHNDEVSTGVLRTTGTLIGINGSCAGYKFDLTSGEEIIIGKDAKVSMVIIDPAYKEISRKHVGVCYDIIRDQYRVVDYSSNGTWANGRKLIPGQEVYLTHGTELKLANDKNTFRLG